MSFVVVSSKPREANKAVPAANKSARVFDFLRARRAAGTDDVGVSGDRGDTEDMRQPYRIRALLAATSICQPLTNVSD